MGLLDDAIRQHLELKRAHGADPSDVAEQEQEAFGPIKRGDLEVGRALPEDEVPFAAEEPELAVPEPDAGGEWVAEPEPEAHTVPVVEPESGDDVGSVRLEERPPVEQMSAPIPEPESAPIAVPEPVAPVPPAPSAFEDIGEPTQEYAVVDDAPDPQPDAGDELEETPDFLEETPEHDRLWFEQKPPRDFDF